MKSVLITGCSSGVGFHLAKLLANKGGYKVHATMRKITDEVKNKLMENSGGDLFIHTMDVCSDESVNSTVDTIIKQDGKIDVLVNNAGYSQFGCVEMVSMEDVQAQFNTNFYGVIRCSKAVLPFMRKNKWGRVINLSSIGGIYGQAFNDIYCASKFALEGLSMSMAPLYKQFGIRVILIEPGAIRTSFTANVVKPETSKVEADFLPYLKSLMDTYAEMFKNESRSQTGEEVAESIIKVIEDEDPPYRVQTNPATKLIYDMIFKDPSGKPEVLANEKTFFSLIPGK